jgi:hypothetical protein
VTKQQSPLGQVAPIDQTISHEIVSRVVGRGSTLRRLARTESLFRVACYQVALGLRLG